VRQLSPDSVSRLVGPVAEAFGQLFSPSIELTSSQVQLLAKALQGPLAGSATVSGLRHSATVYQDGSSTHGAGMSATLVAAGQEWPGKDVAILKVDGHNMPTAPVGDDAQLSKGDPVYAVGYPADATFNEFTNPTTFSATISQGGVSNRLQSSAGGYQVIEHTATQNHGSSGGALVNARGQAVGITTAGDPSLVNNQTSNGGILFYAVPTSVVNELLDKAGVRPSSSPDQALYNDGFDLVTSGQNSAAYEKLAKARDDGFSTPDLTPLLDRIPAAARHAPEHSSASGASPGSVILIGLAVAAVVLLLGSLVLAAARHRKRTPNTLGAGELWLSADGQVRQGASMPPPGPASTRRAPPGWPPPPPPPAVMRARLPAEPQPPDNEMVTRPMQRDETAHPEDWGYRGSRDEETIRS
jgi:serine protease Do